MTKLTKAQKARRSELQSASRSAMKRKRLGRLMTEAGTPLVITCAFPTSHFGFPVKEVDPMTRALIDAACAERGMK